MCVSLNSFRKSRIGAPENFFLFEANGLKWLTQTKGPRVVKIQKINANEYLDLEKIVPAGADKNSMVSFGKDLAKMHNFSTKQFGLMPDGNVLDSGKRGYYFGPLSDPIFLKEYPTSSWQEYFWECQLLPMMNEGIKRGQF